MRDEEWQKEGREEAESVPLLQAVVVNLALSLVLTVTLRVALGNPEVVKTWLGESSMLPEVLVVTLRVTVAC